ncbi:hypothetical protein LguiA_001019 [Lonicera macranthoides]
MSTNYIAEAKALLQGLQLCRKENIFTVDVEIDSLLFVNIIQEQCKVPWALAYIIRELKLLLQQMSFSIRLSYRETNKCADYLANLGVKERKFLCFRRANLPDELAGISRVDRSGLFNF